MRPVNRGRRGFFIIELLMATFVLGFFFLAATRLFTATMKVNQSAAETHTQTVRLETAIARLRKDVWSGKEISARDDGVTVQGFDGSTAKWTVGKEAVERRWTREGKTELLNWAVTVPGMKLEKRAAGVTVLIPESQRVRGAQIELVNQSAVARRLAQ